MPGMTPWAIASPMNAIPRSTTQVPTSEVVTTVSRLASSARCMNAFVANGSINQSTSSSSAQQDDSASATRCATVRIMPE